MAENKKKAKKIYTLDEIKFNSSNSTMAILACIPIVGLVAVAAALAFIYPLNKKRVEENVIELKKRRGEI